MSNGVKNEVAVFGGGCFWCLEPLFARLKGIKSTTTGYAGGDQPTPTYEAVCSGKTGHAEIVKVEYDPNIIPFEQLLNFFFSVHDPTTPNRQGSDLGSQYRSIILYTSERQKNEAEKFIEKLNREKIYSAPVVTELRPLEKFWSAEKYHQRYFEKNPDKAYCQFNISPKIGKLRKQFKHLWK